MKVLIVRIGALGDAIHALPMVNELRRLAPEATIDWAAGGGVRKFLAGHRAVSNFVPVDKGPRGLLRAIKAVRGKYDVAIDAQGLMKSAALARSAALRVVGRARGFAREFPATFFYSDHVAPKKKHILEQNLELLGPLFPHASEHEIRYDIPLPAAPRWDLLDENPILFNIGGGWWTKLWSPESFAKLACEIDANLGIPVGIVWGPGEEEIARRIAARSPARVAPATTFGELGAILQRARLLVSGETGPLHLAVAVGCRTIALLGPTSASRNGPHEHTRAGAGHLAIETDLSCSPCHARRCSDFRCMPSITANAVYKEIAALAR